MIPAMFEDSYSSSSRMVSFHIGGLFAPCWRPVERAEGHLCPFQEPGSGQPRLGLALPPKAMGEEKAALLPFGPTTNEALHAELNKWFRGLVQLHQTTLQLKLKVFRVMKLLTHNAAAYRQTTVQMSQSTVRHRVAMATDPWTPDQWRNWCGGSTTQTSASVVRAGLARKLKAWAKGKPGARARKKPPQKRTVFTLNKGLALLKRAGAMKKGSARRAMN